MSEILALELMGWHPVLADAFAPHGAAGRIAGRVVSEERGHFVLNDGIETRTATVTGRLRHESGGDPLAYPVVGDWVAATASPDGTLTIHSLLPRSSAIVRRAPVDHGSGVQAIAANVDVVFIVSSLSAELNLRRLERYLAVAWESGALPVVILSKSDLDDDVPGHVVAVAAVAPGVEVIAASAVTGEGIESIRAHLTSGRTVAFIGSSGVGKSTLVNTLAGHELMTVSGIREDDARGRHTTTRRQLVRLAEGLVIDTPGMREMSLNDGAGLASAFDDVQQVAANCRFSDCAHLAEPGCAVRAALVSGTLDADRFTAFQKLEREAHRAELANDAVARKAERRKWSAMIKEVERRMDRKHGPER